MKIGFVLDDGLDVPDGVQQYVLTLGKWFTDQGHQVHYLAGHTTRTDIPNIHSLSRNVKVRFNQNKLSVPLPVSSKKLKAFLDEQKFDVLHVQMPYSPQFAGRLVKVAPAGTAIVGTVHILPYGLMQKAGSWALSKILSSSLARFDLVASVSDAAQHFALDTMGITSDVIPNAVDLSKYALGKPLAEYADGKQNVVFLGRLVPRKGASELLKAIQLLSSLGKFDNARCIIVGSGPEERKLKNYVKKHLLSDKVVFTGQAEESQKANLFASANVIALPSLGGESFGIVVVEAIASGQAVVIGGDNPGYRFVLADTVTTLVNPKKTKQLADSIRQLLDDPGASQLLHTAQSQRIRQFDITSIGPRVLDMYTQAISKHGKLSS